VTNTTRPPPRRVGMLHWSPAAPSILHLQLEALRCGIRPLVQGRGYRIASIAIEDASVGVSDVTHGPGTHLRREDMLHWSPATPSILHLELELLRCGIMPLVQGRGYGIASIVIEDAWAGVTDVTHAPGTLLRRAGMLHWSPAAPSILHLELEALRCGIRPLVSGRG
jgi:hypothetical protein